jgi:V/A-type H+-transporting ATPase subunit E
VNQVDDLESAILARANRLADEYRQRAQRSRDNILQEASDRLRLREEREVLMAKADAERSYRRKVQSSELRFHKEMDHLRWSLVQGVRERLKARLAELVEDEDRYFPLLKAYLRQGAEQVEAAELVAELNARDLERLRPRWAAFSAEAAPGKRITPAPLPFDAIGGVLVHSADNRIRLNNTFEGRMERLDNLLFQTIVERLLPTTNAMKGTVL